MSYTINLTIEGRPISKKNSRQHVTTRDGRKFVIPSEAFRTFQQIALAQLNQYRNIQLIGPYKVSYRFFMKGNLDADMDNLIAGVNDILQEAGIIDNDKNIRKFGESEKIAGNKDWKTEICIEPFY